MVVEGAGAGTYDGRMGILIPLLSKTIVVQTKASVQDARARIHAQTLWLEKPPGMKYERIPYRLFWLLMPDAPETDRAFYGHRGAEGVCISRVPDEFQTSFQPVGTPVFESKDDGCQVNIRLEVSTRAARVALLTGALALLFAGLVPSLLPPGSSFSWAFCGTGILIAGLNRLFVGAMFKREVRVFGEAMERVLGVRPRT